MHDLILWAGFAGAWLLVAGPVLQAARELSEEDLERERFPDLMAAVPPPAPVSPWWWLVPPVRLVLGRRQRERWQEAFVTSLPDQDYEALRSYMATARGWLLVGGGGFLIAVKETYELVEGLEWRLWVFWVLVVVMVLGALGNAAAISARDARELARRQEARRSADGEHLDR